MSEPTAHDILLRGYVDALTRLTRLLLDAGCDSDRAADALSPLTALFASSPTSPLSVR